MGQIISETSSRNEKLTSLFGTSIERMNSSVSLKTAWDHKHNSNQFINTQDIRIRHWPMVYGMGISNIWCIISAISKISAICQVSGTLKSEKIFTITYQYQKRFKTIENMAPC